MQNKLEKLGSFGAILAAAACPICFPKLALIGALIGFGALAEYETIFFYAVHVLVGLALIGNFTAYRRNKNKPVLAIAGASVALFFLSLYVFVSEWLSYLALAALVGTTLWHIIEHQRCKKCQAT